MNRGLKIGSGPSLGGLGAFGIKGGGASSWTPATALDGALPKLWLQSNDASTLFQDNAKTTPATAANDPVGAWADKSGNGNDVISPSDTMRPLLKLAVLGGKNGLLWDGSNDSLRRAGFFDTTWNKAFSGLIVTTRNEVTTAGPVSIGATASNFYLREFPAVATNINHGGFGTTVAARANQVSGGTIRQLTAFSYDGVCLKIKTNRHTRSIFTATNFGFSANDPLAIGSTNTGTFTYSTHIMEVLLYKAGLSDSSLMSMMSYGANQYGLTIPTINKKIVFVGDSLTWGTGATDTNVSWPDLFMITGANSNAYCYNFGTPGYQASNQAAANPLAAVTAICDSNTVCFVWLGTNDAVSSRTQVQIYGDLSTICSTIKATGAKVVVCTIIARGNLSAPQETVRLGVNTDLVNNYATIGTALLDLAADARFQNASDTTYYAADTIHLKDAGYAAVRDLALAVYNTL